MRKKWVRLIVRTGILLFFLFLGIPIGKSDLIRSFNPEEDFKSFASTVPNDILYPEELNVIGKRISRFINRWELPGASVAVAYNGELKYAKAFGFANLEDKTEATPDHKFRMASVSKLLTAVAIMRLHEERQLHLDDRVFGPQGVLPDSIFSPVRDTRVYDITIRHLLGHAGGWSHRYGDHLFMPHVVAEEMGRGLPVTERDIINFALSKKLHFTPGAYVSYSNLGYVILGEVIAFSSGTSYEEYVQNEVLKPLGIRSFHIGRSLPEDKHPGEVSYYEVDNATLVLSAMGNGDSVLRSRGGNDISVLGAAGGWIGSASDMLKIILAVDGSAHFPDILDPESVKIMNNPDGPGPYGWRRTDRNGNLYRSGSFSGSVALAFSRSDGIAWVVIMNGSSWKGADFPQYIKTEMDRITSSIDEWPDYDLFYYPYSKPALPQQ